METEYRYICARCNSNSISGYCLREDRLYSNGDCERMKCVVDKLTPVDKPIKTGELPRNAQRWVDYYLDLYGFAFVQKSTYVRLAYGEKKIYDKYITFNSGQVSIGQINRWSKRSDFIKFTK